MTQAVLAGLVGRSEDWLSKIERGDRTIQRLDVLVTVAKALRVSLADLIGAPVLMEDLEEEKDDIPAVRDALMSAISLSSSIFKKQVDPVSLPLLRADTERAWDAFQAGKLGEVVDSLPDLIRSAQAAEQSADAGPGGGWAVSGRIHHLAATSLAKLGEGDLSWIAAERAMKAADMSQDALVLASSMRCGVHALLAAGRFNEALQIGEEAATWLASQRAIETPEGASLAGMLRLRSAIAAARNDDRSTATEMIRLAEASAVFVPKDSNLWQTGFNASNVAVHKIACWIELGDFMDASEVGPYVDISPLPAERQAAHLIDVGRAMSAVGRDEESLHHFLRAEKCARQLVYHNLSVREAIREMHRRTPYTSSQAKPIREFAARCRAI